jgi:membrane protease YdiL (CAAX protease family)
LAGPRPILNSRDPVGPDVPPGGPEARASDLRPIDGILVFGVYLLVWTLSAGLLSPLLSSRMVTLVSTVLPAAAALLALRGCVDRPLSCLGLGRPRPGLVLLAVLAGLAVIPPAMSLEALVITRFKVPKDVLDLLEEIIKAESLPELAYVLAVAAVGAAVFEELIFRGVLQRALSRLLGNRAGLLVASLVFGLLHDPWRLPAAFILGLVLGLIYLRTGSLVLSMVAHFTVNSVAVVALYVIEKRGEAGVPAWVLEDQPAPWWLVVASLGVFAVLARALFRDRRVA